MFDNPNYKAYDIYRVMSITEYKKKIEYGIKRDINTFT